jgi:GNAT superfamily N-acetyltransferase
MCDEWMPTLELPLTWEQFLHLPRNAAYKYEYLEGKALLTPRAKHYHGLLDLHAYRPSEHKPPEDVILRPMTDDDFLPLEVAFKEAFHRIQPFGSLDDGMQREAAHQCLQRTRTGGDGPWIQEASFAAVDREGQRQGAILITLLPAGDPGEWESYYWSQPPSAAFVAQRHGRPHVTWIFVAPASAGSSVGSALLAAAVQSLLASGYRQLATTFMLGNESSMLWHWRNGFQLLPHPGSLRRVRERYRDKAR